MKSPRNPGTVHAPLGGYTHQIEVTGPHRWLVLAGQVGVGLDGEVPEDPIEQFAVALENLRRNLEAAGMTVADLVKITVYLVGELDFRELVGVLGEWLGANEPPMIILYVAGLANAALRVEVDAWACRSDAAGHDAQQ
ncbi:RidA family protein [Saccharothrix sp. Mg75]|uniref:RidA family protein n=1 Tax=Saccharothrix sp. Mg75 TaxID=3445357 RepID=UPI003EEE4F27